MNIEAVHDGTRHLCFAPKQPKERLTALENPKVASYRLVSLRLGDRRCSPSSRTRRSRARSVGSSERLYFTRCLRRAR